MRKSPGIIYLWTVGLTTTILKSRHRRGGIARYPAADDLQFVSVSLVSKYIIFGVGLLVALFFLPFVVYMGTRSLNKRSDPAAAARIGLLIGVLASFGLYLYLFWSVYGGLGTVIAAIAALGVLIALFSAPPRGLVPSAMDIYPQDLGRKAQEEGAAASGTSAGDGRAALRSRAANTRPEAGALGTLQHGLLVRHERGSRPGVCASD